MKLTEAQIKQMVRQAVRKQLGGPLVNEAPVHQAAIKQGMAAGKKAAGQRGGTPRYAPGEMAQAGRRSAQKAKKRKDMSKRFKSTSDYLKKVFGDSAKVYSNNTVKVSVGGSYEVNVALQPRDSVAGSVFVVEIAKGGQTVDSQELGIGIGAKQKIARFIKKVAKQVQSGQMKEAKRQLQKMIQQIVYEEYKGYDD